MCGAALAVAGCAPSPRAPNLTEIYRTVAAAGVAEGRAPLITVPGTLGSRLVDAETCTVIWGGGSAGLSADPTDPQEARLIALPIPADDTPVVALNDTVRSAGVLDIATAEVLGLPIELEVYGGVLRTLTAGGFRTARRGQPKTVFARAGPEGAQDLDADAILRPAVLRREAPAEAVRERAARGARDCTAQGLMPEGAPPAGDTDEINSFRFDYDWRRDIVSLARDFDRFVTERKEWLAARRSALAGRTVAAEELRFDLLAHSMGGLVTRYYLMYGTADLPEDGSLPPLTWAGARHFNRVVFVATPNAGSILALDNIVNGKVFGPFQPYYPGALLATHPSLWQLMPRARHAPVRLGSDDGAPAMDLYDPALWERHGWGFAAPEAAPVLEVLMPEETEPATRRARALRHQARLLRRAEAFHRAMDRWHEPPTHLRSFLVVGGGFETPARATLDPDSGALAISGVGEGDGVVLRSSVLLDERLGRIVPPPSATGLSTPLRFDTVLFLPDEHVELTKNPVFGDNLLFWLLEQPRETRELRRPSRDQGLVAGFPLPEPRAAPAEAGVLAANAGAER